jgi:hypothetical protein
MRVNKFLWSANHMKIKTVYISLVIVLFCAATPAFAEMSSGPQETFSILGILFSTIVLTVLGRRYGTLLKAKPSAGRMIGYGLSALAVFFGSAILSGGGLAFPLGALFSCIALIQGGRMLRRGLRGRPGSAVPASFSTSSPNRLISAGSMLIVITLMLMSVITVFDLYSPAAQFSREYRLEGIKALTAHLTALSRDDSRAKEDLSRAAEAFISEHHMPAMSDGIMILPGRDAKGFILQATPILPPFPFNYLTRQPAYLSDETGTIRMCYVNTRGTTCPPDALIVVEGVSNEASPVSGYDGDVKKSMKSKSGI